MSSWIIDYISFVLFSLAQILMNEHSWWSWWLYRASWHLRRSEAKFRKLMKGYTLFRLGSCTPSAVSHDINAWRIKAVPSKPKIFLQIQNGNRSFLRQYWVGKVRAVSHMPWTLGLRLRYKCVTVLDLYLMRTVHLTYGRRKVLTMKCSWRRRMLDLYKMMAP